MKAVYAGSFDPFTFGHLEIVRETTKFFDEVIILCAVNSKKNLTFSRASMIAGIKKCLEREGLCNVRVVSSDALTADICAEYGADLENVVYAFDDGWYEEHSGQILLIRLGVVAGLIVAGAVLWALGDSLLKRRKS